MTSEDLKLDPGFFLTHQPLTLYRLARARYANLSGVGAAFAPGRWNRAGEGAIYTSTEVSVPLLERLVHISKDLIPSNLAILKIRVTGNWEIHKSAITDPQTDGCIWFYRDIATAKKHFNAGQHLYGGGMNPFGVAIPSIIVPVWNVILYPQGVGFWNHVSLESVDAFEFDPRLFSENASVETPEQDIAR